MNEALVLESRDVGSMGLDDLLALAGLPLRRRSTRELSSSAEEILRGISLFIDDLLLKAITPQTRGDFISVREELFASYAGALTHLAGIVRVVVPVVAIERVLVESFCELEAEFSEQGLARFGSAAKAQAMFTIWTLRRTSGIISKIAASGSVPKILKEQDEKLASHFGFYITWTQFHIDCMLASIRRNKPLQLDVLVEVVNGLKAAVNAYGYSREGLNLRIPKEEPQIQPYQWDDEDQELLNSSMRDMELEAFDD